MIYLSEMAIFHYNVRKNWRLILVMYQDDGSQRRLICFRYLPGSQYGKWSHVPMHSIHGEVFLPEPDRVTKRPGRAQRIP